MLTDTVLELVLPLKLQSPNKLRGFHWHTRHRETQVFQAALSIIGGVDLKTWSVVTGVEWRVDQRGHQKPYEIRRKERRRVTVIRQVATRRQFIRDDENLHFAVKPLNDALKRLGLLYDDSRTWLEQPPVEQQVSPDGQARTIVRLERTEASDAA